MISDHTEQQIQCSQEMVSIFGWTVLDAVFRAISLSQLPFKKSADLISATEEISIIFFEHVSLPHMSTQRWIAQKVGLLIKCVRQRIGYINKLPKNKSKKENVKWFILIFVYTQNKFESRLLPQIMRSITGSEELCYAFSF